MAYAFDLNVIKLMMKMEPKGKRYKIQVCAILAGIISLTFAGLYL